MLKLAECRNLKSVSFERCHGPSTKGIIAFIEQSKSLEQVTFCEALDRTVTTSWDIRKIEEAASQKGIRVVKPNREATLLERLSSACSSASSFFQFEETHDIYEIFEKLPEADRNWIFKRYSELSGKPAEMLMPEKIKNHYNKDGQLWWLWLRMGEAVKDFIEHQNSLVHPTLAR